MCESKILSGELSNYKFPLMTNTTSTIFVWIILGILTWNLNSKINNIHMVFLLLLIVYR